jgi:hypothetical protein
MASRRTNPPNQSKTRRPPATTPEGRENQLVALAIDQAEKQIREGTASSQVLTHFLKLGSPRERLERQRLQKENEMLDAKIESIASAKRVEELYETALNAMRSYAGQVEPLQIEEGYEDL